MDTELALLKAQIAYLQAALGQARWLLETPPPLMPANSNDAWLAARELWMRETTIEATK